MKWIPTRRQFLKCSTTLAAGIALCPGLASGRSRSEDVLLSIGIMTDPHAADLDTWSTRYYRESLAKMEECVELMNDKKVDLMIELGDLVNGAPENNLEHARQAEQVYSQFRGDRYHVLGNHDLDALTKEAFQSVVENSGIPSEQTWFSFDRNGFHIVVLDACFRSDGTPYAEGDFHWTDCHIPRQQMEWLKKDLAGTHRPSLICVHQLLDGDGADNYYINNAEAVRTILEESGNVLAVFQGHQHQGQYNRINSIHYQTYRAVVEGSGEENNAYSIVRVRKNHSIEITGYRRAETRNLG